MPQDCCSHQPVDMLAALWCDNPVSLGSVAVQAALDAFVRIAANLQ